MQDLHVGDLLSTGTPAGCALERAVAGQQRVAALLPEAAKWKMFMNVQAGRTQYLKAGDVVEGSIATPTARSISACSAIASSMRLSRCVHRPRGRRRLLLALARALGFDLAGANALWRRRSRPWT